MNILDKAKNLGFIASGISPCDKPLFFDVFRSWVNAGKCGEMDWITRHQDLRENPEKLLPNCRTIISLAHPYNSDRPCTPEGFHMARYSEPQKEDYHRRLRKKAGILACEIETSYPNAKTRICVDSAPILERSFAYQSGVGFLGKNNMLIVPGYGSYLFLAEILTTAELPLDGNSPLRHDLCGNCTRCLDACPTGALEAPWQLNASKCLSYLTIEYEGAFDATTQTKMRRSFLGCDICQEACPLNQSNMKDVGCLPGLTAFLNMDETEFTSLFQGTALARPGLWRIKRNIEAIYT